MTCMLSRSKRRRGEPVQLVNLMVSTGLYYRISVLYVMVRSVVILQNLLPLMSGVNDMEDDDFDQPRSFNGHSKDPGDVLAAGCLWVVLSLLFIMVFCAVLGPYLP